WSAWLQFLPLVQTPTPSSQLLAPTCHSQRLLPAFMVGSVETALADGHRVRRRCALPRFVPTD
ncbi:MAG: hypothetical protein KDA91_17430, partial [Planctomycetaceae bacterium]|nr:hypothetical protein [Planctomycetaceae bacterium]